jgi:hypothetical protein
MDIFFAGSLESESRFTVRPRLAARRQMTAGLEAARRLLPDLRVDYTTSGPFGNPERMLDPEAYSSRLMQAKIALCPRGNIEETFRLAEAAKSGCVAITGQLPARWYYRDAPLIQVDDWRSLPRVVDAALSDEEGLEERSQQMRRWWESSLSEAAVAGYIASSLSRGHITNAS